MTPHSTQAVCEGISAIAALLAAVLWFSAARHPVGVPGPGALVNTALLKEIAAHGRKILRGASLNKWAAASTGVSALFQFAAWLLPKL
jgi:hypothetical protein